jgi:hypothetical protein
MTSVRQEREEKRWNRHEKWEVVMIFFQSALAPLDPHSAVQVNFQNPHRAPLLLFMTVSPAASAIRRVGFCI